ncbi:MAG: AraC family transcriptional regulator [Bacteroidota bacterium]
MEQLKIQTLDFENLHIAATVEVMSSEEHTVYHPATVIYFMLEGQFNMRMGDHAHTFPEGTFFLVRKYTHGKCFKTWGAHQEGARMIAFLLQDAFIQQVIDQIPAGEVNAEMAKNEIVVPLPNTELLQGLIDSLNAHFSVNKAAELKGDWVRQKTQEALLAIMDADPNLFHVFNEFAAPERADLVDFVNHNFMYNVKLETMARMSGRSLSTFNREFRRIFHETPHRWIMKSRLEMARKLLDQPTRKPSDVYLEVGFEDLAHFSKRFKAYFGMNPSDVKSAL